jgi:alpha-glucosidase
MRKILLCAVLPVFIFFGAIIYRAAQAGPAGGYDFRDGYQSEDESTIKKIQICDGEVQVFAWGAGKDIVRIRAVRKGTSFTPDPFMLTIPAQKGEIVRSAAGYIVNGYELRPLSSGYELYKNNTLLYKSEFKKDSAGIIEKRFCSGSSPEYLSGMGHASSSVIKNKESFKVYHYPTWGSMTHMYIPFVMSSGGDAFYNNAAVKDAVTFGPDGSGAMDYSTKSNALDYYYYCGSSQKETVSRFYDMTKSKSLLPKWAYGFIQSKYGYKNQAELEKIIDEFVSRKIPLSAVVLDLYWFKTMGDLEWDRDAWPDPAALDKKLESHGIKLVTITEPFVMTQSKNFKYYKENGALALTESGEVTTAKIWLGSGALLDPVSANAGAIIGKKYDEMIASGIDGFWTDLGEPEADAAGAVFGGTAMKDFHNYYNREWSRLIYRHLRETHPQMRVFNLTRSGAAGSGAYGVSHWSGDVASNFGALANQIGLGINDGIAGFSYFGSDVGGFAGTPSGDLFTRWYQFGAFSPVFRAHGSDSEREPWRYGSGEGYDARIRYIQLRYKMLPYIYSEAWQTAKNGVPMMRSLTMEFPSDLSLYEKNRKYLVREYMFGGSILVSPVTEGGADEADIYLPSGDWYDFHTGEKVSGGEKTVPVTIRDIPVYVRAGSIIPWDEDMNGQADTLLLYPSAASSSFVWYEDDGTSNNYQKGDYEEISVSLSGNAVSFSGVKKAKSLALKTMKNGVFMEKRVTVQPGKSSVQL